METEFYLTGLEMYFLERAGYFVRRACMKIPPISWNSPDPVSLKFALEIFAQPCVSIAARELFGNVKAKQIMYCFSNPLAEIKTKTLYHVSPRKDAYYEAVDIMVALTHNLSLEVVSGSHADLTTEIYPETNTVSTEPVWTALKLSKGDVVFTNSKLSLMWRHPEDSFEAFLNMQLVSTLALSRELNLANQEAPDAIRSFFTDL